MAHVARAGVAESYSGGILQLLIQVWSALLPAIDPSSFVACTVCVVILTALYLPFAEDTAIGRP